MYHSISSTHWWWCVSFNFINTLMVVCVIQFHQHTDGGVHHSISSTHWWWCVSRIKLGGGGRTLKNCAELMVGYFVWKIIQFFFILTHWWWELLQNHSISMNTLIVDNYNVFQVHYIFNVNQLRGYNQGSCGLQKLTDGRTDGRTSSVWATGVKPHYTKRSNKQNVWWEIYLRKSVRDMHRPFCRDYFTLSCAVVDIN